MKFRLLTYNHLYKSPAHPEKITTIKPDIVLLQEVKPARVEEISQVLKAEVYQRDHLPRAGGSAIISRFPIAGRAHMPLANTWGMAGNRRIYMEAIVQLPDKSDLAVGVVHLPTHLASRTRRWRQIQRLARLIKSHQRRFVLAGDFNATPDSRYIEHILKTTQLTHTGPDLSIPTWTFSDWGRNYKLGRLKIPWKLRLDFVFATPDLKVTDSHTLPAHPSDHSPIVVDFKI